MKKLTLSMLVLLTAVMGAQAKSWKIGPSSVAGMDFASINDAMAADEVAAGDTLYLDQYYNENKEQTVNKTVVIIGTGYDTSLNDEQVVATLTASISLKADAVVLKSILLDHVYLYNKECVIERCKTNDIGVKSSTAGMNHVYSCYVSHIIFGYGESTDQYSMMDIQNNFFNYDGNWSHIRGLKSSIIKNNVFDRYNGYGYRDGYRNFYCLEGVISSQIENNIILNTNSGYYDNDLAESVTASGSGNSIEHNILSHKSALTYYPNNKTGYGSASSEIFAQTGTYSNYYKLADASVAKGYATDGGDCGCHGGMFGCPSGGRPQYIPYFKKVTVGSRTEDGKLPVTLKIAIQSE